MEEKRKKSIKIRNLVLTIFTRIVQIGIFLVLFEMTGPFFDAAEMIFGEPQTFMDEKFVYGIGVTPLFGFIPVWILTESVRMRLKFKLTGLKEEEYKAYIIDKMPLEVLEKARSYEANGDKLMKYLRSVRKELHFTKDEIVYVYALCYDSKKEQDRIESEKCEAKEEKRARREKRFQKFKESVSEETGKKADEVRKQLSSFIKRK
ncbi:MAG: hypothetical protein IJ381_08025 [Clostridia bacterium]|nr:hypothetical protein [Clostridia bacterium]